MRQVEAVRISDIYRNAEMPESPLSRTDMCAKRFTHGDSHPVLAIVVFFAAFLFGALPFVFDTDSFLIVAPCLIACFSSVILFLRLLVGDVGPVKYIFLFIAGYLGYVAGEQWYVVVFLAGGALLCSLFIDRLIGDFVAVIRDVKF